MQSVTIRPAVETDIPEMARLWYEKTVLHQQFDRRFTLLADATLKWSDEATHWLTDQQCAVLVACLEDRLIGYLIGWVRPGPAGMSPEHLGVITELTIDPHRYEGALGRGLLESFRDWLAVRRISHVVAWVPHRQAVEQAFWRSLGATEWLHIMWISS